jgi:hypothetical protein
MNYYYIMVNTWVTQGVPWVVDEDYDPEILAKLREAVLKLPTRVQLPKYFSELSLPRYYQIYFDDEFNIAEIAGVRWDGSPTKWGYRIGYWHPQCQISIARALSLAISKKVTQEVASP